MIKASKKKHKEGEMMQSRNLYVRGDDKKKLPCNPSPATATSRSFDEVLSHGEGCNNPQINMIFDVLPSGVPPHIGGICLLGSTAKAEDLPLEAHQALIAEILSAKGDSSLKKDYMDHLLQSSKYHPDESLEEGSSIRLSHEQMIEYAGVFRDFYDPVAEYMEGLGKGSDGLHLCFDDQFVCHYPLLLFISFMSIKHEKRTILLGKLLDWLHWKSNFT